MFIQLKWTCWHLLIIYSLIVLIIASSFVDALSDKRLCADEKCLATISVGIITVNYRPGEYGMLPLKQNSIVNIKSKGFGSRPDIWGVEYNGMQGYIPKIFVKETKIFIPDSKLQFIVDVPPLRTLPTPSEKTPNPKVNIETQSTEPLENTTISVAISETPTPTKLSNASDDSSNTETTQITPTSNLGVADATTTVITHETTTALPNSQIIPTDSGNHIENNNENTDENKEQIGDEATTKQNENSLEIKENLSVEQELGGSSISPHLTPPSTSMENTTINNLRNPEDVSKEPDLLMPEDKNDSSIKSSDHTDDGTVTSRKVISEEETATQTSNGIQNDQLPDGIVSINKNSEEINLNGISSSYDSIQQQTSKLLNENRQQEENQVKANDIKFQHSVEKSHLQTHNTTNVTNDTKSSNFNTKDHEEHLLTGTTVPSNVKREINTEQMLSNTSHSHSNKQYETTISENSNETPIQVENEQILNITTTTSSIIDSLTPSPTNNRDLDKNSSHETLNTTTKDEKQTISSTSKAYDSSTKTQSFSQDQKLPIVEAETTAAPTYPKPSQLNASNSPTDKRNLDNNSSNETLQTAVKDGKIQISSTPQLNNAQDQKLPIVQAETTASPTFPKTSPLNIKVKESPEPLADIKNEILTERILHETTTLPSINASINTNMNLITSSATNPVNATVSSNSQSTSTDISASSPNVQEKAKEKTDQIPASDVHYAFYSNAFNPTRPSVERPSEVSTEINTTSEPEAILNDSTSTLTDIDTKNNDINTLILETSTSTHSSDTSDTTNVVKDNNDFTKETIETINKSFVKLVETSTTAIPETTIETDPDVVTENDVPSISSTLAVEQFVVTTPQTLVDDIFFSPPEEATISPLTKQTTTSPAKANQEIKEKGLFATILGTVNNFISSDRKAAEQTTSQTIIPDHDAELHQMLYGDVKMQSNEVAEGYCENLGPEECPGSVSVLQSDSKCSCSQKFLEMEEDDLNVNYFLEILASKILDASELLTFLIVAAGASLFFIFVYYCFCNSSREGALLSKLNQLESSLLASHKENCILKHNLLTTRQKLSCIEDNSFGSNDMVASLKKELEEELTEKAHLKEQIVTLQKELETAADAGIELNKIVADLLSNQTGDESILSSVENLQKQLNEQQNIIMEINNSLADKSRENSELQLMVKEQNTRYEMEIANLRRDNDELEAEKDNLLGRLNEVKNDFDRDMTAALESKNYEIKRLQNEIVEFNDKFEKEHSKLQTSSAKVEALEDCLKNLKCNPKMNITEVIDMANVKAEVLDAQKKYQSVNERLTNEMDGRKLAENQIQLLNTEVQKLKRDFNQSEKDKLEAQTRLEVLSNYFKDKENQLQKELSLKETMWLKQQGETTTTVERLTAMKDEIQSLKSQNDALRAEIEAQIAAHKAQIGTLENRAHETWLAARQADRRCEEARTEASALRRQLTAIAGNPANEVNRGIGGLEELANAPSPLHIEAPNSPLLGRMPPPPPPPFLPPPFMGPPPAFMGMPPPPPPPAAPFAPAGEMRPAPLGRLMSPLPFKRSRFSPQHFDYEDYLDRDASWPRHTFSPAARSYRSLSPTDSRYNYGNERSDIHSIYDTETDFSPPSSPQLTRRLHRDNNQQSVIYNNNKIMNDKLHSATAKSKRVPSSGSDRSYNSSVRNNQHQNSGSGKSFV